MNVFPHPIIHHPFAYGIGPRQAPSVPLSI